MNNFTENEIIEFLNETSQLVASEKTKDITNGYNAYKNSIGTVKEVEFWKWMDANYAKCGYFNNSESIKNYISQGVGKENWMRQQLQGKGYEWDWMMSEQSKFSNITNKFTAGNDPTQAGIDVVKKNILNDKISTYQHKSYLNKTKVNGTALKNTPNDATVITQSENISSVTKSGYKCEAFQSKELSSKIRDKRLDKASKGLSETSYNLRTVSNVMGKAAVTGVIIGATTEALLSYKNYKTGQISKTQYLKEIAKSSGNSGVTSGITAGIMIPIQSAVVSAGCSIPITIPIAIAVGVGVDKFIAPAFGRGQYAKDLDKMRFYKDIGNAYIDFITECDKSFNHFNSYLNRIVQQRNINIELRSKHKDVNNRLISALDRI